MIHSASRIGYRNFEQFRTPLDLVWVSTTLANPGRKRIGEKRKYRSFSCCITGRRQFYSTKLLAPPCLSIPQIMTITHHHIWWIQPAWGHTTSGIATIVRMLQLNPGLVITVMQHQIAGKYLFSMRSWNVKSASSSTDSMSSC